MRGSVILMSDKCFVQEPECFTPDISKVVHGTFSVEEVVQSVVNSDELLKQKSIVTEQEELNSWKKMCPHLV